MTNEEAICRIGWMTAWTNDEKDLEAIRMAREALMQVTGKLKNVEISLLKADTETCKAQKSKLDLVGRQAAIEGIREYINEYKYNDIKWAAMKEAEMLIESLPSAEPPYQYSEAYVRQIRGERDILQDMVNNMAERPTVDAVEVVRCKDCKRYESDGGALMTCTLTDLIVDEDCYCWWGERRKP